MSERGKSFAKGTWFASLLRARSVVPGTCFGSNGGFERIVNGLDVPVIPVHIDGIWGSIFSFKDGRWLWKLPRRIPYPVTVSFGKAMPSTAKAHEVRRAVMEIGAAAVDYRRNAGDLLHLYFLRAAKRRWFSFCMTDSSGTELNYGQALIGSLALSRLIRRECLHESMVGLLLPSSVGGALANIAVLLAGKVPVNLNFTAGEEAMRSAIEQCGIKTILTSLLFLKKAKLPQMEGMVFVERLMKRITPPRKARTAIAAFLLPSGLLRMVYSREQRDPGSLATVIFSSGSTGTPKGVMLSHHNILSNIESIAQIFRLTEKDRMMGVLPFFHSFGFTVSLWFPIVSGFGAVYHANPLDAKTIGEMVAKYKATILISTPTFYSAYLRKCSSRAVLLSPLRSGRCREVTGAAGQSVRREVPSQASGGLRDYRDGAGGFGEHSGFCRGKHPSDWIQGGDGRPSGSRGCR